MATIQELMGIDSEPNVIGMVEDPLDMEVMAIPEKKQQEARIKDEIGPGALHFLDRGYEPPEILKPESPNKQFEEGIYDHERLAKRIGTPFSIAGKGLSWVSEGFKRLNQIFTSLPVTQYTHKQSGVMADNIKASAAKAVQLHAMLKDDKNPEEAYRYADNIVGDVKPYSEIGVNFLENFTTLVSPPAWSKFFETANDSLFTPLDEETGQVYPTFGESLGGTYYQTLVGKEPSKAWIGLIDWSAETIMTAPLTTAKVVKGTSQALSSKLTAKEIGVLRQHFSPSFVDDLVKTPREAKRQLKVILGIKGAMTDAKVEKALAIKAFDHLEEFKRITGIREIRAGREISPEELHSAREIMEAILDQAEPAQRAVRAQKAVSLAKKYRSASGARTGAKGEQAARQARWALKGEDYVHDFDIDLSFLTQDMKDEVFDVVNALPEWDAQHASSGLWKLFDKKLPNRSEVAAIEKALGSGIASKIEVLANRKLDIPRILVDFANIPRAIQTSFDMGAPFRQGNWALKTGYMDEWSRSFKAMINAGGSQKYADSIADMASTGPRALLYRQSGLDITSVSRFGKLTAREEQYLSTMAERIPGIGRAVKWSERTHVSFLNHLRMSIFDDVAARWRYSGRELSATDYKALAEYVNHVTGRGDMKGATRVLNNAFGLFGKEVKDLSIPQAANGFLYSPRFLISKIQTHTDVLPAVVGGTESKLVRGLVARDIVHYYYNNIQFLRLAKASEDIMGWSVEEDPTSTDFGKIKVGNTRYDVWGPTAPLMRYVARMQSGVSKSATTGDFSDINRKDLSLRFLRGKVSPVAGLAWDIGSGETFLGNDVDLTSVASLGEIAYNQLIPLVAQDFIDALKYNEGGIINPIVSGGSSFFGNGLVSYEPSAFQQAYQAKDRIAMETFGKPISELEPIEVYQVSLAASVDPHILNLERKGLYESNDLGEFVLEVQRNAEKEIIDGLPKTTQKVLENTSTPIRDVSRSIRIDGVSYRLKYEDYKMYLGYISENIHKNIENQYRPSESTEVIHLFVESEVVDELVGQAIEESKLQIYQDIFFRAILEYQDNETQ